MSGNNLSQTKALTAVEQVSIMDSAIDAILNNLAEIDKHKASAKKANDDADGAANNQLGILRKALEPIPEPITEEMWDSVFKARVAEHLTTWTVNGVRKDRYASKNARDVMVNTLKVATMGLTLAAHDPEFKSSMPPTLFHTGNLKKFADGVRPILQATDDPATGKPRLRSIATTLKPKAPKKLSGETRYWLIACEDAGLGVKGANVVIGGDHDLKKLESWAKSLEKTYASFFYVAAKMEELPEPESETPPEPEIVNSAVFAQSVSST